MSSNQGAVAFAQGAKDLALLSAIPLDSSPEKFSRGVSRAFDKTREGKTRSFLSELFIAYAADYPATSGQFSRDFQRAIEQAGKPLIDAVKSRLRQAPSDSPAATVVAPQFEAYEQMLRDNERERQEEIERKRKEEKEEKQRQKEERDRQQAVLAAQAKAAQFAQRLLLWGAVALAGLPLLIAGINYCSAWWSESNYAAALFYTLFALVGLRLYRGIVALQGYETELRNLWAAWLTAGLMVLLAYLSWSSVPNIVKALMVAGAVGLPFTPYARGALGSIAAGIIAALIFYFAARICSFVVMAFLGWVLPEGSLSKPLPQTSSSALSGVSAIGSFGLPSGAARAVQGASYTARISPRDLRNSKGVYLPQVSGVKARDILLQERFNYHDGVNRDYEDTADSIHDPRQRSRMRKVFESRQVRVDGGGDAMALLESNPVLSVTVTDNEIVISPVR
jgi:hypothetical protein